MTISRTATQTLPLLQQQHDTSITVTEYCGRPTLAFRKCKTICKYFLRRNYSSLPLFCHKSLSLFLSKKIISFQKDLCMF